MAKVTTTSGSKLDRLDTFVLAGVVTIFLTRAFLAATNYPQIGSDSLHVAHVLYGGAVLVASFLYVLLSEKPNKLVAALVGGIGFGLFIDEVGKFVTQDNDYFFQPAIGIIYISFLIIWFVARLIIVRSEGLPLLSPAEWPHRTWQRSLIRFWSLFQAILGILLLPLIVFFGFPDISSVLNIPSLGLIATILYAGSLAYGLWRYNGGLKVAAAHDLRGATLFGIVAVYPFYYLNHPAIASLCIIPTLMVIIGLSEVSFISLLKKLSVRSN